MHKIIYNSKKMGPLALFFYCFSLFVLSTCAEISNKIGINYGQLGNNLPSKYDSIQFIKSMKAGRVKIYDANPEILKLLSGTKLQVSIMVPNHEIISIASQQSTADQWVQNNVLAYYPQTMIRFILVGNEVLSSPDKKIWHHLVPAMRRIKNSLSAQNIRNIKVGTPLAMDIFQATYPPSNGIFRSDISDSVMIPLLQFLNHTRSFFFIDVYPYFPWSANPTITGLDYALFRATSNYTDPVSGLIYTNMLDQMLDSLVFAMARLGFSNIRIVIAETGWPNAGDIDEVGANTYNAATYNRNLIKRMTTKPALGTPARPGLVIPTFIFSLYDENQKTGRGTERHWGLLHPSGRPIYDMDITGKRPLSDYKPLPVAHNNEPYKGKVWCVVAKGVDLMELGRALTYACGEGNETCAALAPGRECYEPLSVFWHASFAFSSYWAQFQTKGGICYFNGLAQQTTINPSRGRCKFPSVTL
ncbi:hypothetical protein JRO89_XS03G0041700 [Xanthoceras sorbifolium]|uniref:glucan endo-1,3-beta-D-glucosidase n=1 Tax=Xanthoceras sorbifolium TaxID=99658 RepID=A0ABQ8I8L2_9ROSI|nr:hypothetical protein JRO89_XS03G0041700 [Xanthoceras sorbifolium]